MSFYEHVFIARPDINESQVKSLVQDFSKTIKDNGGKVKNDEYWGLRKLAYKIKKNSKAHYVLLNIDAPHPAVAEMERQERLEDNILRFMTIRVDELEDGPSVMIRSKSEDEYDDRDKKSRPGRKKGDKK